MDKNTQLHEQHHNPAAQIEQAYQVWRNRQDRASHPNGHFDGMGRWYPDVEEKMRCCSAIREPSAAYPYSILKHCRSTEHIANLYDVPVAQLRSRIAQNRETAVREGGGEYYKAVAVKNGCFVSIFDGKTEYVLGETITERARQQHGGGIYVYSTEQEARHAQVPECSELHDAPRVVLHVKAEGAYCRYDNGKLAFSRVTPLRLCG